MTNLAKRLAVYSPGFAPKRLARNYKILADTDSNSERQRKLNQGAALFHDL